MMTFKIGDRVVHPQYGVGTVVTLEDREFEHGVVHQYYEVAIEGGSTVWVPIKEFSSGLRKLARKNEIEHCRMILASRPMELAEDRRVRQSELTAQLKQGTMAAQCEAVRDLSAYGSPKPMLGNIGFFLRAIQDVLAQEWALVEGTTMAQAVYEISSLLERSRLTLIDAGPSDLPQIGAK